MDGLVNYTKLKLNINNYYWKLIIKLFYDLRLRIINTVVWL